MAKQTLGHNAANGSNEPMRSYVLSQGLVS